MADKKSRNNQKQKKAQQAPGWTAESFFARAFFGVLLCACGAMVLLAVGFQLDSPAFGMTRSIAYGTAGALSLLFALLLIWGGVLLVVSASRKPPVRPFLIALPFFLLLEAFLIMVTLVTTGLNSTPVPLMEHLWPNNQLSPSWWQMIVQSYNYGVNTGGYGGGAIGMLLGYPLYRIQGHVVAAVIAGVLMAVCLVLLLWNPVRQALARASAHSGGYPQALPGRAPGKAQQAQLPPPSGNGGPAPIPVHGWQQAPQPAVSSYGFAPVPEESQYLPAGEEGRGGGYLHRLFRREEQPLTVRPAVRQPLDVLPSPESYVLESPVEDLPQEPPARVSNRARNKAQTAEAPASAEAPAAVQPAPGETADDPSVFSPDRLTRQPAGGKPKAASRRPAPKEEEDSMTPYVFPTLDLLASPQKSTEDNTAEDQLRARRLVETLTSFKVDAKVKYITHGPAVTRFELEIPQGIKVSRVTSLGDNIAMQVEAKDVRIEAPIPGKSLIGVEVPNRSVATVTLREVLESAEMRANRNPLTVALGRDIAGTPILCNLEKMPHMLIAGATGSGKSVCINAIINSLLFRCTPDQVRLILVDPKMVELQCYNGVPHLLLPVVSDPHKASAALEWAVEEMMARYTKFQQSSVRSIDGYNSHLPEGEKAMPRIVIIIDELADLMMVCKRDVEERICRLAQLARAAGIHLVVATQRPSVDVITGLIKANIPSRIAFKVSSFTDSRTILDGNGADKLLGYGDMLYKPMGQFSPVRIQGCFLSDDEVNRVTDFIRASCPAHYDPEIIDHLEHANDDPTVSASVDDFAGESGNGGGGGTDLSLLAQCIEIAVEDGQVSTSMLQRKLRVGYSRAGRLVDEMEKRGIVSQQDGTKPRQCLISREEFEAMKAEGKF